MQNTSGIRAILSLPSIYDLVQNMVGARRNRREFVRRYVEPGDGTVVLDIGCGTGDILDALPKVTYFGCDISPEYIERARERFGDRGRFILGAISKEVVDELPPLDRVVMHGVLHHMSDEVATGVMGLVVDRLKPDGRFVSIDPCFTPEQSRLARFIISRDRGRCVRTPEGYRALGAQVFSSVDVAVRHDLNRIPYSHAILSCRP